VNGLTYLCEYAGGTTDSTINEVPCKATLLDAPAKRCIERTHYHLECNNQIAGPITGGRCEISDISEDPLEVYCEFVPSSSNNQGGIPAGNDNNNNTPTGFMCPADSNKPAASYVKYTCPNGCTFTSEGGTPDWRCYENWSPSSTLPTLGADECGQIDVLDAGGAYCGHTVNNCDQPQCQRTQSSPQPTETPNPAGPMCMSISMKVNEVAYSSNTKVKIGDSIQLTCGLVNGVTRYRFRVIESDGTITSLLATGANSAPFTIRKAGQTTAQCQICTGSEDSTCHAFPGEQSTSAASNLNRPGTGLPLDSDVSATKTNGSNSNR